MDEKAGTSTAARRSVSRASRLVLKIGAVATSIIILLRVSIRATLTLIPVSILFLVLDRPSPNAIPRVVLMLRFIIIIAHQFVVTFNPCISIHFPIPNQTGISIRLILILNIGKGTMPRGGLPIAVFL